MLVERSEHRITETIARCAVAEFDKSRELFFAFRVLVLTRRKRNPADAIPFVQHEIV
jgi:hypothetical protein